MQDWPDLLPPAVLQSCDSRLSSSVHITSPHAGWPPPCCQRDRRHMRLYCSASCWFDDPAVLCGHDGLDILLGSTLLHPAISCPNVQWNSCHRTRVARCMSVHMVPLIAVPCHADESNDGSCRHSPSRQQTGQASTSHSARLWSSASRQHSAAG